MNFYYHIWSNEEAVLSIVARSGRNFSAPFWSISSNYGDQWNRGQVTVRKFLEDKPFAVVFEAFVDDDKWEGSLALDDILIEDRECPAAGACDFENQYDRFCTWEQEQARDESDWLVANSQTALQGVGPAVDHTFGNLYGHYIYMGKRSFLLCFYLAHFLINLRFFRNSFPKN